MAECTTECQEINPDQSRCEVIQKHPSHLGDEENEQEVKEGISQKCGRYLPNGKIRLAVDDNGLVTHSARTVEHETDALPVDNISSNCQCDRSHDSMEATGHRSKKNKSLDSQLSELASEFDSLDLDTDSKEPVVEKPDQELEKDVLNGIEYVVYKSEVQMPDIMRLITKDLSEPYSIYTYRYFIHNWPKLCFLAMDGEKCVGAIVCKLDMHKKMVRRGYIAMLAIDSEYRRKKIGSHLVLKAIKAMIADDCDEVVLETEITNQPALRLYENLGFVRDKRLFRYYLNGVDALRLKLWLR